METAYLIFIIVLVQIIGNLIISLKFSFKSVRHKKALISVLRHRLGDRQDVSDKFTLDELKEINVWSGKLINDIYDNRQSPFPIYDPPPPPPKKQTKK